MPKKKSPGTLAENRKARHDYIIEDTIEAGIVLQGTEIKSIRRGSANLKDSYAQVTCFSFNFLVFVKRFVFSITITMFLFVTTVFTFTLFLLFALLIFRAV